MRLGRYGEGDPMRPTGRSVDELSDLADEMAMRQPEAPETAKVARWAVENAERLREQDGSLANQRRLARALWRRVSTFGMPEERDAVEQTALRCWAVCVGMLEAARGDAVAFDDVVGDVGMWAGVLVPALGSVGRHADAAQVYETSAAAAGRAMGVHGRRARARLMVFPLAATADAMAEQRVRGAWNAASEEALADAIASCRDVIAVLLDHLRDGPFEVSEVARVLQVLSRLQTVGGRWQEAGATLDEAIELSAMVADQGPRYATVLHGLRTERDGLRGPVPAPQAPPLTTVPRRAFQRAGRDAGMAADELPSDDPSAVLAVERMRLAESLDPVRHGPGYGLLMAWRALLLVEQGDPDLACDVADRAVQQLSRYSDRPERIQASLVVALAVLHRAAKACGRTAQADRAAQRAAVVHSILTTRDATYTPDLAGTV